MKSHLSLFLVPVLLLPASAAAQDADLEAQAAEAHAQYAEFLSDGNVDGLLDLFSDDATLRPVSGGQYTGSAEIRQALEAQPTPTEATIEGVHLERMNGVIVDIGTFSLTMPPEAGGEEMDGEYVAILADDADGLSIQHLISFPKRQPLPVDE